MLCAHACCARTRVVRARVVRARVSRARAVRARAVRARAVRTRACCVRARVLSPQGTFDLMLYINVYSIPFCFAYLITNGELLVLFTLSISVRLLWPPLSATAIATATAVAFRAYAAWAVATGRGLPAPRALDGARPASRAYMLHHLRVFICQTEPLVS